MQKTELAQVEYSHPPLHDDVSDEYFSCFSDSSIDDDYYDMNSYHYSPICPKWDEKTVEAARDLASNPLDSRKTSYQFHNAYSPRELNISDRCFMMVGFDPQTYKEASIEHGWKTNMQEEFKSLQDNKTWELVPFPSEKNIVKCK